MPRKKLIDMDNPKNWGDPKTGARYRFYTMEGKGHNNVLKWAREFEDTTKNKKRFVAKTYTRFGFRVSTVWMGSDHQFGKGKPHIFETMVFVGDRSGEVDMDRYTTKEEALFGHNLMVKRWGSPFYVLRHFLLVRISDFFDEHRTTKQIVKCLVWSAVLLFIQNILKANPLFFVVGWLVGSEIL